MAFRFNPFTATLDYFEPSSAAGANATLSNLTSPTAINQHLIPSGTRSLGEAGNEWDVGFIDTPRIGRGSGGTAYWYAAGSTLIGQVSATSQTLPSGTTSEFSFQAFFQAGTPNSVMGFYSASNATNDANRTKDVCIETGNKTSGTGNSGDIILQPGTSVGGNPGTMYLNGGVKVARRAISSSTTLLTSDTYIEASGNITLTLPPVAGLVGKLYTITKTDALGANPIVIDGNSSETINGATTFELHTQHESVTIQTNAVGWQVVGRYIPGTITDFTPTGSWVTNTTYYGTWSRTGRYANLNYVLELAGAPTAAVLTVNLPTDIVIDTAAFPNSLAGPLGHAYLVDTGTLTYVGVVQVSSSTTVAPIVLVSSGTYTSGSSTTSAVPHVFANTDAIRFNISVPVVGWEG